MTQDLKEYTLKPKMVQARKVEHPELVKCYNGIKMANIGDYVVIDEEDRVMVIRGDRFEHNYMAAID